MTRDLLPIFTLKLERRDIPLNYPKKVSDQLAARDICQAFLQDKDCEHLIVLLMDGYHNFLGLSVVGVGGITGLHVSARDVFKTAIIHRASAIILSHNHPSSGLDPSQEDLTFTDRIAKLGKELDCPLLDHIIVSSGITPGYRSIYSPS